MELEEEARRVRSTSLGWMMQRIARRLDQSMDDRLSRHDMTLQQFAVMMTVLEFPGLSQTEIGDRYAMPPYAISRAIDHLEATGWLERRKHPSSRRTHTIHATGNGRDQGRELFAIVREVNDELAQPLTPQERAQFHDLLRRLLEAYANQGARKPHDG